MNIKPIFLASGGVQKLLKAAVYVAAAVILIWVAVSAYTRIRSEYRNNTVEICLDFDEVTALCAVNNYPLGDFLERSKAIGVASAVINEDTLSSLSLSEKIIYFAGSDYSKLKLLDIAVQGGMVETNLIATQDVEIAQYLAGVLKHRYNIEAKKRKAGKYHLLYPLVEQSYVPAFWNDRLPVGFSRQKIALLKSKELNAVCAVQNTGNPAWLDLTGADDVSSVIWENAELPGYPGKEYEFAGALAQNGIRFIDLEFGSAPGSDGLKKNIPELLIRGHQIPVVELGRVRDAGHWLARWMRAVKERNIRFLYFRFWKNRGIEENIDYLRQTARKLKESGFELGTAGPPDYPKSGANKFRVYLALLASVIMPLAGLKYALRRAGPYASFVAVNMLTVTGGLFIAAMLNDVLFLQKITDLPHVRPVFFITIILSIPLLFKSEQLKTFWNTGLQVKHLILAGFIALVAAVIIVRGGNSAAEWMHPDQGFRQLLENLLVIRPRTKEFLIGQPLLFAGFFFKNPWLILAGMIGQASISNTFMHAHTSLSVTLIRTFNGLWLGLLVGLVLVKLWPVAAGVLQDGFKRFKK